MGWALGILTTLVLMAASGGWYQYRWYSPDLCAWSKVGAINADSFEVVPGQSDPCYLRRPRIRPWEWPDGVAERMRGILGQ